MEKDRKGVGKEERKRGEQRERERKIEREGVGKR